MSTQPLPSKLRVVIVGGGVAGLEAALALHELAPGLAVTTVLAPNTELVDRPMTVREPFAYPEADHYALEPIVRDAGAELVAGELAWVDPVKRIVHTRSEAELEYDALVLALGARITPRYEHAITIDDRNLDETMHGLIQDVEEGYVKSLAFVAPGRMAWPLPLYELALMSAARAFDMGVEVNITIVTPEDSPLAIFGSFASNAIGDLLKRAKIRVVTSAYAEIPRTGEIAINPGDRHLKVDRVVALPELYGPSVRGVPSIEHGFLRVDSHCKLIDVDGIYAAGDATDFAVKHGRVDRRPRRCDADAPSVSPCDPRHAPHRWQAALSHRPDHGRAGLQLADRRGADVVATEQGRLEVPRALSRGTRDRGEMSAGTHAAWPLAAGA